MSPVQRRTSHLAGRRGGDPPRDEPGGTKQSGVGRGKGEGLSWFMAVGWAAETGRG